MIRMLTFYFIFFFSFFSPISSLSLLPFPSSLSLFAFFASRTISERREEERGERERRGGGKKQSVERERHIWFQNKNGEFLYTPPHTILPSSPPPLSRIPLISLFVAFFLPLLKTGGRERKGRWKRLGRMELFERSVCMY